MSGVTLGVPEHAEGEWRDLRTALSGTTGTPCTSSHRNDWYGGIKAQRRAADACLDCPVLAECRAYALAAGEPAGTWGGLTDHDRKGRNTP